MRFTRREGGPAPPGLRLAPRPPPQYLFGSVSAVAASLTLATPWARGDAPASAGGCREPPAPPRRRGSRGPALESLVLSLIWVLSFVLVLGSSPLAPPFCLSSSARLEGPGGGTAPHSGGVGGTGGLTGGGARPDPAGDRGGGQRGARGGGGRLRGPLLPQLLREQKGRSPAQGGRCCLAPCPQPGAGAEGPRHRTVCTSHTHRGGGMGRLVLPPPPPAPPQGPGGPQSLAFSGSCSPFLTFGGCGGLQPRGARTAIPGGTGAPPHPP